MAKQQLSTNTFGVAKWVVSPDPTQGTHTTITGAMASASSGDTIYVRDGTYTESFTATAGVSLVSFPVENQTPNVIINGTITVSAAGTFSISGFQIQNPINYLFEISGASAVTCNINNCHLLSTNASALILSSSNSASVVNIENCTGELLSNLINYWNLVGNGTINIGSCTFSNPGASTQASFNQQGNVNIYYSNIYAPVSNTSAGSLSVAFSTINSSSVSTASIASSGVGTLFVDNSTLSSGSATAVTIGAGLTANVSSCFIISTATDAIGGSGILNYNGLVFGGSSQFQNTLTLNLQGSSPSNATSGFVWTSTGQFTSPTWQAGVTDGGFTVVNQQVFTTSGTYTPYNVAGKTMRYCQVQIIGGGGGGGACGNSAGGIGGAGGGGAAENAFGVFNAATIGASQAVTVGGGGSGGAAGINPGIAGTASSLGSLITANPGLGGASSGTALVAASAGGAGGSGGTGGSYRSAGSPGGVGYGSGGVALAGFGGSSVLGSGGVGQANGGSSAAGSAALVYGSGGGGGSSVGTSAAAAGGNGSDGIVIVTEYVQ